MDAIGSYRLVELLGSGAMGEVYKATDSKMFDRVVAVKLLADKYARNEHARSRFQNEIQYAALLDHPNIVKIYDHGEIDGRLFFVMEFLDGPNLAAFIKEERNRLLERSVEVARQLSEALEFAHRHNVVHRDVKPTNVMIVQRGGTEQVKLVDFGIIHVEDSKMTKDGTQPGTKAYSSPEQLRNVPVDHRSDLFSLGIVLYELFTSAYPFDAPSEALITHNILHREPESPRKKNPAIPAAIDALILKLLEKDMTQRPQTAGEVADSLRQQHRKLQSRWASTDPAEYENLDEITREAVDKLVAWARQKEADGALQEAVDAFEKALRLAPDSERIQRRIPKLRHRIESEKLVREHLDRAAAALTAERFPEAREHWHAAWLLSPESEDVSAMELRIERTETAAPDDSEKRKFVDGHVAKAEEALDEGRLDQARSEVVKILQRYPNEPLANFMLERILVIPPDVDYVSYRKLIRDARDLIERGRFAEARVCSDAAQALWPGDEEVAGVERDIAERVDGELAALASRVERKLMQADDPELEPQAALELVAAVRADVAKARGLGSAAWIGSSSDEADRVERAVHERVARAAAVIREQADQRRKRIEMFLQRGRNQLSTADSVAKTVGTEPAPAIEAYRQARESYENVLQDDAGNAEALDARRAIEERLRGLAERVERARIEDLEIGSALEAARAAVADAEVAGGARAADLGMIAAFLDEADAAVDRVLAIAPKQDDAMALREQVAGLRTAVRTERDRRAKREEQARRETEAAALRVQEETRKAEEAERRRAEEERRAEDERRAADERRAEDESRAEVERRAEDERRAEAERRAEDERRAEAERRVEAERPAPRKKPATAPEPVPQQVAEADPRKLAEFEKGLLKYQRLVKQGKTREAAEIQKILQKEASSVPQLEERYAAAFPESKREGSRRGLVMGIAAGIVLVAALGWLIFGRQPKQEPSVDVVAAPPPAPFSLPPEPQPTPEAVTKPVVTPPAIPPPLVKQDPPKPKPSAEVVNPPNSTPNGNGKDAKDVPSNPIPVPTQVPVVPITPPEDKSQPPPAAVKERTRLLTCLVTAADTPVGAGFHVYVSVSDRSDVLESTLTDGNGCATVEIPMSKATAGVGPEYVLNPAGTRVEISKPPPVRLTRGTTGHLNVRLKD